MTQDEIWEELHSKGTKEWKERREGFRESLLDKLAPPNTVREKMDADERAKWIEEQKALINEYYRLRDKLAPRPIGSENGYRGERVASQEEMEALIGELESVTDELKLRVSLKEMDADEREEWDEEVLGFSIEISRARDKLRYLSRLPEDDPKISELLKLYERWNEEARKRRERYEEMRMSRWGLFYSIIGESHAMEFERNRLEEAAKAEGIRDGILMALWAFDYAPDKIERMSDFGRAIPLP